MSAPRGLFVTGTDTGVGKTLVAAGLLRLALRRGLAPIPFKPVETGCDPDPADARRLWQAAAPPIDLADVCMHALPLPAAPALAAAATGLRIDLIAVADRAYALGRQGGFLWSRAPEASSSRTPAARPRGSPRASACPCWSSGAPRSGRSTTSP